MGCILFLVLRICWVVVYRFFVLVGVRLIWWISFRMCFDFRVVIFLGVFVMVNSVGVILFIFLLVVWVDRVIVTSSVYGL